MKNYTRLYSKQMFWHDQTCILHVSTVWLTECLTDCGHQFTDAGDPNCLVAGSETWSSVNAWYWYMCVSSGQSAPEAEKNYLDNAKLLAFYGVDLHRATVCIQCRLSDLITTLGATWQCDSFLCWSYLCQISIYYSEIGITEFTTQSYKPPHPNHVSMLPCKSVSWA